jgi:hypothetical protein
VILMHYTWYPAVCNNIRHNSCSFSAMFPRTTAGTYQPFQQAQATSSSLLLLHLYFRSITLQMLYHVCHGCGVPPRQCLLVLTLSWSSKDTYMIITQI